MGYRGIGVILHLFLIRALDVGEWSASRSGCVALFAENPGTHKAAGCVGPRVNRYGSGEEKRLFPLPEFKLRPRLAPGQTLYLLSCRNCCYSIWSN